MFSSWNHSGTYLPKERHLLYLPLPSSSFPAEQHTQYMSRRHWREQYAILIMPYTRRAGGAESPGGGGSRLQACLLGSALFKSSLGLEKLESTVCMSAHVTICLPAAHQNSCSAAIQARHYFHFVLLVISSIHILKGNDEVCPDKDKLHNLSDV